MKRLTSLLIGCSLALAGAALAQQPGSTPANVLRTRTKSNQANERTASATATPPAKHAINTKGTGTDKREMPVDSNGGAETSPAQTPSGKHAVNTKGTGAQNGRQSGSPTPSR